MGDLDGLPFQELGADPPGDDRLKVGDPLCLHTLALGLLALAIENGPHPAPAARPAASPGSRW
jgi:hypothetical protein